MGDARYHLFISMHNIWYTVSRLWETNPSVIIASVALLISVASLGVSALNLGWNIFKEFMQGGRMKVKLMNAMMILTENGPHPKRLTVSITNHGPRKTRACMLHLRKTSWWRRILRREKFAALQIDYRDPLSGKMPADLEVGGKVDLTFRYLSNFFLNADFNQLGVMDPFGRMYWCSRENYEDVRKKFFEKKAEYEKDFEGQE